MGSGTGKVVKAATPSPIHRLLDTAGSSIPDTMGGEDTCCIPHPDTIAGQKVVSFAEEGAVFPGGDAGLMRYLSQHLIYPAEQHELQGSVFVTFVIDTLGRATRPCIFKRLHQGGMTPLEKEMLAVVANMPRWKPAALKGKKVPVRYYLPLRF